MGETYVGTYLGCDIYFYTPPTVAYDQYGSPCLTSNYVTLAAVKKRICTGQGGTWDGSKCSFEPEEPEEDIYIETYLGCKIYYTTRIVGGAYYSPCTQVYHHDKLDVKKDICEQQDGVWDGASCSFEPEPEPGWEYHSTYRGIDIQVWMPDGTPFTAYFDGEWHTAASLSTLQAAIDDFLEPVGISTTTTLSAPGKIGVNEKFNISGILYETESGIPIPTQPINHSYNGRSLGGSTTGGDGDYLKEVSIPESGTWTLKSDFPGTPGYAVSTSVADTMVAASPLEAALKIAAPAATGLALIIYSLS